MSPRKYLLLSFCVLFTMEQELTTFLNVPENNDFTLHNIPFGVVSTEGHGKFPATIIGTTVINLK